ncbi:MAG: hypothetical protein ACHQC8_02675 [Solirubrobacterales bacterium]
MRVAARKQRRAAVTVAPGLVPGHLTAEVLADLRYLEPNRSRDALVRILNEMGERLVTLEEMHRADQP